MIDQEELRYEYVYGDVIEEPKSLIKKFKDFFNR